MARTDEIRSCHICVNTSCAEWGSQDVVRLLQERLDGSDVQVRTHICFGACWTGPNIVLYPVGTWYANVQPTDIDEIIRHIQGGDPVTRLLYQPDPALHELTLSLLETELD